MTWTRVLLWKTLKKGLNKSLFFRYCFGKILLNKVYNCVLCEKSNKLFCYWKINIWFFPPSDEFFNFYDGAGSVLDSQHYIHPCAYEGDFGSFWQKVDFLIINVLPILRYLKYLSPDKCGCEWNSFSRKKELKPSGFTKPIIV